MKRLHLVLVAVAIALFLTFAGCDDATDETASEATTTTSKAEPKSAPDNDNEAKDDKRSQDKADGDSDPPGCDDQLARLENSTVNEVYTREDYLVDLHSLQLNCPETAADAGLYVPLSKECKELSQEDCNAFLPDEAPNDAYR